MFPVTDDSTTIINCLKQEAQKYDVDVRTRARVEAIESTGNKQYELSIRGEESETFDVVVITPGGSNRRGTYEWLEKLGHSIVERLPIYFQF